MNTLVSLPTGCLLTLILFSVYVHSKTPIILPSDGEIIYRSKEEIKLQCSSDEPIYWTFPSAPNIFVNYSKIDDVYYGLLYAPSAVYSHTGYYNCKTANTEAEGSTTDVYIFVPDKKRLLLSDDLSVIMARPGDDVIFPCTPTSPDVQVSLRRYQDEEKSVLDVKYDYTRGFIFHNVSLRHRGMYECKGVLGEVTYQSEILLSVLPYTVSVSKPVINTTEDLYVQPGENVTLLCSVEAELGSLVWLKWKVPNQLRELYFEKDDHIIMGKTIRETSVSLDSEIASSLLTIRNISPYDEGDYLCLVKDHDKRKNYNQVHITVEDSSKRLMVFT